MLSQTTNNILSPDEPTEFQIEISSRACDFILFLFLFSLLNRIYLANVLIILADGKITISREGETIVEAFDQNPLDVNYVSLGSLDTNGATDYYYNCRGDADFDNSDHLKADMIARASVYNSSPDLQIPTGSLLVIAIFYSILLL